MRMIFRMRNDFRRRRDPRGQIVVGDSRQGVLKRGFDFGEFAESQILTKAKAASDEF